MWYNNINTDKLSKEDILKYLVDEMKMQKDIYTKQIRKGNMTEQKAIHKASCCKAAYLLIKKMTDKQNGVQGDLFEQQFQSTLIETHLQTLTQFIKNIRYTNDKDGLEEAMNQIQRLNKGIMKECQK